MSAGRHSDLVLTLRIFYRGIGFVLFEGPRQPIDWGVREIRGQDKGALAVQAIKEMIVRQQPDVIVLEDRTGSDGPRSRRSRSVARFVAAFAAEQAIDVHQFSRAEVRECFKQLGAVTRDQIARVIARHIPAFRHRLPPVRKPWMNDDPRMSLFDAASLAMTFYWHRGEFPI